LNAVENKPDRMTRTARSRERDIGRSLEGADTSRWQGSTIELRRLIAEFWGTLLLTLVATAGAALHKTQPSDVSAAAAVIAPGAMVMSIIYFMGSVSGAHVNPAVTFAFALRRNFPWIRVPGYIAAQLLGCLAGAAILYLILGIDGRFGASSPGQGISMVKAFGLEVLLTAVLVNTILGTASEAGFLGPNAAIPVGAYIALAGLWAGSLTGASMNPARSIGPDLLWAHYSTTWIYIAGPLLGAALGVALEWALKGKPSAAAARAAQGDGDGDGDAR
jgi:aquaporin Z